MQAVIATSIAVVEITGCALKSWVSNPSVIKWKNNLHFSLSPHISFFCPFCSPIPYLSNYYPYFPLFLAPSLISKPGSLGEFSD